MKLTGRIIKVETTGDGLRIRAQAQIGRADWMPIEAQEIIIADTTINQQTFHVGRNVTIEIKPTRKKPA